MLRKLFVIGVVGLVVAVLLAGDLAMVAPAQVSAAPASQGTDAAGKYMWNYSVKFVCGLQRGADAGAQTPGEPPVKPGNYATEINIHNYSYRQVPVLKKIVPLVRKGETIGREPNKQGPIDKRDSIKLGPDFATLDDCNRLWELMGETLQPQMPLTIGYLVILSPVDLDIDAVYTAQVSAILGANVPAQPVSVSIDVERVQGKRVFVPIAELNKFPQPPAQ